MSKPKFLYNEEAAQFLGVSPKTLNTWRCKQTYDLPYTKLGRGVRYDEDDLIRFLESRKIQPQGE